MSQNIRWSTLDLDDLEQLYWDDIAPAMYADDLDPEAEPPTYQWLADNGYRGLEYALREVHDTTVQTFFTEYVGIGETPGFEWGISHEPTLEELDQYIDHLKTRKERQESTVNTIRSRLATYARTHDKVHDTADLISPLGDLDRRPEAISKAIGVFDVLDNQLGTDSSRLRYLRDTRSWYAYLIRRGKAKYNPLENLENDYPWDVDSSQSDSKYDVSDTVALNASHVRDLYEAAETPGERLLIVGLAGWGLRPDELARLNASQIQLDQEDPVIEFDSRKNGPGSVSILYGWEQLAERTAELDGEGADNGWNQYLFPSPEAEKDHIIRQTVQNRFDRIRARIGLEEVEGEKPVPKMCRRFWYSSYLDAMRKMNEDLQEFIPDQGSSSADVVVEDYLPPEIQREYRREMMRRSLATAFGDTNAEN